MTAAGPSRTQLQTLETYQSTSSSRLKFLYSDFSRQKHSNPASFTSNVEWWKRTLEAVVLSGWQSLSSAESATPDRLVLHATGPAIIERFRVEGVGKPLGLATVIAELQQTKSFVSLTQFRNSKQSIYDPGWLPYRIVSFVLGKPLWWALQQLSIVGIDDSGGSESDAERWKKVKGDYVVVTLLEQAAEAVLRKQHAKAGVSLAESLYSFESFRREFHACAFDGRDLSSLDIQVLVKFLERERHAVVVRGEVIKFVDESSHEITAVDAGILELKSAVVNLEASTERIQAQIDDRAAKVLAALKQNRKEVALSHLRQKKQLEDVLKKRLNALNTLQSTLIRVEAAAADAEIMKSYESSTATLRAILSHEMLQREKIDETMDAMASANADAKDIDEVIRIGVAVAQSEAGIDDAELEDELAALVKEAEDEKKAAARTKEERETERKLTAAELNAPSGVPVLDNTSIVYKEKETA